jgi:hypothetical protein
LSGFLRNNPQISGYLTEIFIMREFNVPYSELETIRSGEPLKWEFWKNFLTEEGYQHDKRMKKLKKGRRR